MIAPKCGWVDARLPLLGWQFECAIVLRPRDGRCDLSPNVMGYLPFLVGSELPLILGWAWPSPPRRLLHIAPGS